MKRILLGIATMLVSTTAFAQFRVPSSEMKPKGASAVELNSITGSEYSAPLKPFASPTWTPVQDTADFKYVLLSADSYISESDNLRYTIAKNLPEGVKLVLLVRPSNLAQAQKIYKQYISLDRVIFATTNDTNNSFWARDAFPYPVRNFDGSLSLVQARYYRQFNAGPVLAQTLQLPHQNFSFTFVGGNLLADEDGNCFTVLGPRMFNTKEADLKNAYGCKTTHLMKHVAGIGDVDEVIKPLGNKLMLTNQPSFVSELENLGYRVVLLPQIPKSYRTYANSLVVGKTVFMPSYGVAKDAEAQKVYEDLGYKVVSIKSNVLSDEYNGSIHCQTMAYPAIDEELLLRSLNATRL